VTSRRVALRAPGVATLVSALPPVETTHNSTARRRFERAVGRLPSWRPPVGPPTGMRVSGHRYPARIACLWIHVGGLGTCGVMWSGRVREIARSKKGGSVARLRLSDLSTRLQGLPFFLVAGSGATRVSPTCVGRDRRTLAT